MIYNNIYQNTKEEKWAKIQSFTVMTKSQNRTIRMNFLRKIHMYYKIQIFILHLFLTVKYFALILIMPANHNQILRKPIKMLNFQGNAKQTKIQNQFKMKISSKIDGEKIEIPNLSLRK